LAGLDPKTKSYLGFHIYRYVKSKYRPHLSDKEKGAVIHEIFDEVHELVRKFGESKVEWKEKIFEEIRENWETGAKKDIVDLIKKTFEDYERGKKEEERIEREVSKKKRIKIKHTPYTCTYEGCEGKVLEYEYEDGEKVYYCEKNPDEHFWLSQGDLKEETEKFAERKVGEGITEPKPPHEGIAEIDALFKEMSGYPSMSKIIKALKKKEEWNKLSMEDKKAYVSKFLKHPALKNKIKGLQGKKRKLGFLPVPWWASPEYYEEANVLTGFQERKEEAAIEIGYERDKLRKKYGPWKWWLRPKYYAEKNAKVGELRDKYYMGGGFGSEEEAFLRGRLIGGINRIAGRHSDHVRGVMPAIVIFGLGAVISAILGSLMFFFAFCSIAFQQLMPPAKEKTDNEGKGIGEWENLGSAYLRSVFKCTAIILFALGIGQTNLPFANIFLMLVAVGGYAAMKVTYHSKRPDELVESFIRFGFLGILYELKIPGWGISGTIGLICLALFFGAHLLVGLAEWVEVLLFALGVALLVAEIFFIPGFGIAGISGIACLLLAVYLALVKTPIPRYSWEYEQFRLAMHTVFWVVVGLPIILVLTWKLLPHTPFYARIVQVAEERADLGFTAESTDSYMGKLGRTVTILRPAGRARFEGRLVDVVAEGEFIPPNTRVKVIDVKGNRVVVIPHEEVEES